MDIILKTSGLNKGHYDYLQERFGEESLRDIELDDLYVFLHSLEDCHITIVNDEFPDDETSLILRVIFDVYDDYHNFELDFTMPEDSSSKIILDVDILNERKHEYLKELFNFPDHYGNNLDALYDCLGELDETEVIVINTDDLNEFSIAVLEVFDEAADEYHNIKLSYEYDENN